MNLNADLNWKGLYELLNDLIRTEDTTTLLSELESNFSTVIPADRGAPMFEIDGSLPICTRWPDYSAKLVPLFNNHFNSICPVIYDSYLDGLTPISWKFFNNSEYDTDFNTPLDIGFSMGQGFYNPLDGKYRIIVLNRSRKSKPFTPADLKFFRSLIDSFSTLYFQRDHKSNKLTREIHAIERCRGNKFLSNRELQICRMLFEQMTAAEIAATLGISRRTVERHNLHIYEKLNVKNTKELINLFEFTT